MFSSITRFFGPRLEVCDCCNHGNIDIALLLDDNEVARRKTTKKRLKNLLASLRWKRLKEHCKKRKASARKSIRKGFRTISKRVRRIGRKKRTFEVRRKGASQNTQAATDTNEQADPLRSAVRQLLTTMFTDIVESDLTIAK
ncbi:hypothetical protein E8E11_004102 [Didymella keratinophila]|nr:hypothetical protein E8E11_004102 [Didymella keratinophila]